MPLVIWDAKLLFHNYFKNNTGNTIYQIKIQFPEVQSVPKYIIFYEIVRIIKMNTVLVSKNEGFNGLWHIMSTDKMQTKKIEFRKKIPPTGAGPSIVLIEDPSLTGQRQRHISEIILSTSCLHTGLRYICYILINKCYSYQKQS